MSAEPSRIASAGARLQCSLPLRRRRVHAPRRHCVRDTATLRQLRCASLAVIESWRDLHPKECARAGRTKKKGPLARASSEHVT